MDLVTRGLSTGSRMLDRMLLHGRDTVLTSEYIFFFLMFRHRKNIFIGKIRESRNAVPSITYAPHYRSRIFPRGPWRTDGCWTKCVGGTCCVAGSPFEHVNWSFQYDDILFDHGSPQFRQHEAYSLFCKWETVSLSHPWRLDWDEAAIAVATFGCKQSWTHYYSLWKFWLCWILWTLHRIQSHWNSSFLYKGTTQITIHRCFSEVAAWPCWTSPSLGRRLPRLILDDARCVARCVFGPKTYDVHEGTRERTEHRYYGEPVSAFAFSEERYNTHGCINIVTSKNDLDPVEPYEDITTASYFETGGLPESFVERLGMSDVCWQFISIQMLFATRYYGSEQHFVQFLPKHSWHTVISLLAILTCLPIGNSRPIVEAPISEGLSSRSWMT